MRRFPVFHERVSIHFAATGFWQLVAKQHIARQFEVCEVFLAMRYYFPRREGGPLLHFDKNYNLFAVDGVGDADGRNLGDFRYLENNVIDF